MLIRSSTHTDLAEVERQYDTCKVGIIMCYYSDPEEGCLNSGNCRDRDRISSYNKDDVYRVIFVRPNQVAIARLTR